MQLICSDINVNAKEYWKDLIEITFVAENKEYLSIARIIYDESVYIEYNDQVNFIKARWKDVIYKINGSEIIMNIKNKINGQNLSADLILDIKAINNNELKQQLVDALNKMLIK